MNVEEPVVKPISQKLILWKCKRLALEILKRKSGGNDKR